MIILNDVLIDEDIFLEKFVCDLGACKGCCCVEGDFGAPLSPKEVSRLETNYEAARQYMSGDNIKAVEEKGFVEIAPDGEPCTTLGPSKECAFASRSGDMLMCAYERAFLDGKTKWRKPVSCYLYPIRVGRSGPFKVMRFHRWDICRCAIANGQKLGVPVYRFLEGPITDAFGADFYAQLCEVAEAYINR